MLKLGPLYWELNKQEPIETEGNFKKLPSFIIHAIERKDNDVSIKTFKKSNKFNSISFTDLKPI